MSSAEILLLHGHLHSEVIEIWQSKAGLVQRL